VAPSPSPIGLSIGANTTHYIFSWNDTAQINGAIISWYCLEIKTATSDSYVQPCVYNSTYPAAGTVVAVPTPTIVQVYGYAPGALLTARLS